VSDAIEEFGPYLVYERLGQGGMATVHRAEKRGVGFRRPIALKRLLPHVAAEPDLIKLFVDEARLASHLHHANVAQTYELGKVGETFFIAMEYASGPTLTQIVRQCQLAAGEIPLTITVNILSQVCEALDYAHNLCDESGQPLRIIHRDVSPANIIVTNTGLVKLIDFGIAKATISSVKTQTGFIKGKFGYIAPEYIAGQIDARVDLFAVGVVAHEMLAGRRLFEGEDDFETLANIREMAIRPPSQWNPHVTPDLDDIVMTALARDPAERWQSAAAMQVALSNAAREFGMVVGSHQLAEWVDWAFSQVPRDSGPMASLEGSGADVGYRASTRGRRDSSVQIELGASPDDALALRRERASSPSDSEETVPLERVHLALGDLFTPPAMAAAPAASASELPARPTPTDAPPAPPPPPQRARPHDSSPPAPPPPPRSRPNDSSPPPSRPSRNHEAATPPPPPPTRARESVPPPIPASREVVLAAPPPPPPPPPPPRPSRPLEAVGSSLDGTPPLPRPEVADERELFIVPPGSMFEMPAPEPPSARPEAAKPEPPRAEPEPRPEPAQPRATAAVKPSQARPSQAVPAEAQPARTVRTRRPPRAAAPPAPATRRGWLWLVLLMVALGAGATAAAYYWPDAF